MRKTSTQTTNVKKGTARDKARRPAVKPARREDYSAATNPDSIPTVLHGAFDAGRLTLWAETRAESAAMAAQSPTKPHRGGARRPSSTDAAARSPFDPGGAALLAAIGAGGVATAEFRAEATAIWLPSTDSGPIASSALIADSPDNAADAALRRWTVNAAALEWPAAIELLCVCAGRTTIAPGVIIGEDLAYWTVAMRLAAAIVARHQFLPALVQHDDLWLARWRPVPDHHSAQAIAQLAAAMPDACRAAGGGDAPPAGNAADVVSAFIECAVDQLARTPRATHRPGTRTPGASFDSIDAQWLHALDSPDPRLDGDRAALDQFRQRVEAWWRPIALGAASPFRLCLRLEEPEAIVTDTSDEVLYDSAASADRPWHLRYLLQAHHDPA